ncbi:MAG TPA: hypothetical protein VI733_03815 [Candidatus Limnocylindria bacterium]|nr:hypothetical protein [Candidatus Limnocylindria bacterium]
MTARSAPEQRSVTGALLTTAIVALTLATAYIHSTLGGLLFTLNALGYAALAIAILVGAAATMSIVVRFSWLPRIGLFGFTLVTILGWVMMGPRFDLAYMTKGIEVGILILLLIDVYRVYGGPGGLVTEAMISIREAVASVRR